MAREINLVPDIKDEMIRTLKLRNFIFFLCIVVSAVSIGVTVVAGVIVGLQKVAINTKTDAINNLSNKLLSYEDLSEFLTIKDQVGNISTLTKDKKVLSRTFEILKAMLPAEGDPDSITISELNVKLSEEAPTFSLEAQADSGTAPFIDYNVLDSFKKTMQYLKFDYGTYVDKDNNSIPAYCMIETNADGAFFRDEEKGFYAYWTINKEGCDPGATKDDEGMVISTASNYTTTDYEGETVVQIWRTPQYKDWYHENTSEGQPQMTVDGQISNTPHFESSCIKYKIELQNNTPVKLDDTNNECMLVPGAGEEEGGISITESSNGRDSSDNLVLRFSANITLAPEAYMFANQHFLALAPSERHNVTDSYRQIQSMFGERATDCAEDDADCKSNTNGGK